MNSIHWNFVHYAEHNLNAILTLILHNNYIILWFDNSIHDGVILIFYDNEQWYLYKFIKKVMLNYAIVRQIFILRYGQIWKFRSCCTNLFLIFYHWCWSCQIKISGLDKNSRDVTWIFPKKNVCCQLFENQKSVLKN